MTVQKGQENDNNFDLDRFSISQSSINISFMKFLDQSCLTEDGSLISSSSFLA